MYEYVKDKKFLHAMKRECADIVNQLVMEINRDRCLSVRAYPMGSGANNLITQNAEQPIDLDYNLEIVEIIDLFYRDDRELSQYIQKKFNIVLRRNGWDDCEDSTSVFTTPLRRLPGKNKTQFKIDLAVVREDEYGWHRFIHEKHDNILSDRFYWNMAPDSKGLVSRAEKLKQEMLWDEVRKKYLDKKNFYLRNNNKPSFVVYVEAVNEVYYANFRNSITIVPLIRFEPIKNTEGNLVWRMCPK